MNAEETEMTEWDGTSDTSWYDDDETIFHIATAEQLSGLSELSSSGKNMSDKTIILDNDILLNNYSSSKKRVWKSIPSFCGVLEGNGHSIIGLYGAGSCSFGSLFYTVDNAVINNLIFKDVSLSTMGVLTFQANNSSISDCQFFGDLTNSSGVYDGSMGDIGLKAVDSKYQGVICGKAIDSRIYCCTTKMNFSSEANFVGGIVGEATNTVIANCANLSNISASYAESHIGGITGTGGYIINCKNSGNITGYYSCGISGGCYQILSCYNTGTISCRRGVSGISYGIAKRADIIKDCFNVGKAMYAITSINVFK